MESEYFLSQKKLAEGGDTDAQIFLATCYSTGLFVEKDEDEAVRWYKEAADRGEPRAQFALALRYMNEKSDCHDERRAFRYFSEAAERGYDRAYGFLAACHYNGTGTRKNESEAVYWYERAASSGDVLAARTLGKIYCFGVASVEKNPEKALRWLGAASDCDDGEATFILGLLFLGGDADGNYDTDVSKGLGYVRKAVKLKNTDAMRCLASAYEDGEIIEKNPEEAFRLYLKAARRGDVKAMTSVAERYESGGAVEKDLAAAFRWRKKAADKGDADAGLRTGLAYMEGDGVDADLKKAEKYFAGVLCGNDGPGKNSPDGSILGRASYYMGEICRRMGKYNVAKSWYEKGAGYGDADAAAALENPPPES